MSGGSDVAAVLADHGVRALFTLCGGHISPILVEAKRRGIRIVDVRAEAAAVFAADATARLTGGVGAAAVTAGPGLTNAVTALENARLAQSPILVLGGGAATALRGRGALQDIDQRAVAAPHVKWQGRAERVRDLPPLVACALAQAREGVPGPTFLECPVDLLYPEETVRRLYADFGGRGGGALARLLSAAIGWHLRRLFAGPRRAPGAPGPEGPPAASAWALRRAVAALRRSERPLLLVGSQALLEATAAPALAEAVARLGVPAYLSGMARGLLGPRHRLLLRHARRKALREADLVILAGLPCDFRLDYGAPLAASRVLSVNRSAQDLYLNRRPQLAFETDPGAFLRRLAEGWEGGSSRWDSWVAALRRRDEEREAEIEVQAAADGDGVNPLALCRAVDRALAPDSVVVADGGDFVGTAAYTVRPRGPLSWLDPGPFGTLGVGGGFALGAKVARPGAEVWLLWGDGSAAFSLAELDTCVRHGLPIIAVVGNDAGWTQIARDQTALLGDDVGTRLARTDYHRVAEGWGAAGLLLERTEQADAVLAEAKALAAAGRPVVVNALLGASEFRRGSLSM
jgi:acetolactate synthase-1/2/3 large subunit